MRISSSDRQFGIMKHYIRRDHAKSIRVLCWFLVATLTGVTTGCRKEIADPVPSIPGESWPSHLFHPSAEWHTYSTAYVTSPSPQWPDTYTLDSLWRTIGPDTIINTYTVVDYSGTVGSSSPKVYHRSIVQRRRVFWELVNGNDPGSNSGTISWITYTDGYFRQDITSKRVFRVGFQTVAPYEVLPYEVLDCDFDLELHDTIPRSTWNFYNASTVHTVDTIEQWPMENGDRKAWHITPADRWLVEGIGFVSNKFVYFRSDVLDYYP